MLSSLNGRLQRRSEICKRTPCLGFVCTPLAQECSVCLGLEFEISFASGFEKKKNILELNFGVELATAPLGRLEKIIANFVLLSGQYGEKICVVGVVINPSLERRKYCSHCIAIGS